jgi:hypothetical protein
LSLNDSNLFYNQNRNKLKNKLFIELTKHLRSRYFSLFVSLPPSSFLYLIHYNSTDESEEENVSSQNPDDEDNSNSEEESTGGNAEGRNEYLTAFPPSRSPELFALINSRVQEQQIIQQQRFQGPYAPQRYQAPYQQQQQPILYRVRQQENNPSVSLAVRVTGGGGGGFSSNNINPYVNRFTPNQYGYQESGEDQFSGYVPPYHQGLRGPYSPNPYR